MIYGLIAPGCLLADAYLSQAPTAKEALTSFKKSFPGIFKQSAYILVAFNDCGTVTRDMRFIKYIPKESNRNFITDKILDKSLLEHY